MSGLIEVNAQTGAQLLNATWLYGAYYNGNLQCATYINGGGTFNQTFTYDGVNRLQTANENIGGMNNQCQITGGAASWSRSFGYDAFGNMTPSGNPATPTVAFNTNNQIATQTYDQAGNLLTVNGNVALSILR
jgi:YD repeat-containing protein